LSLSCQTFAVMLAPAGASVLYFFWPKKGSITISCDASRSPTCVVEESAPLPAHSHLVLCNYAATDKKRSKYFDTQGGFLPSCTVNLHSKRHDNEVYSHISNVLTHNSFSDTFRAIFLGLQCSPCHARIRANHILRM
jgi:hypothetical protein